MGIPFLDPEAEQYMITIVHISDLHICVDAIRPAITQLRDFARKLRLDLDIQFHDESRLRILEECIRAIDPDIVCVTGDLTTFGDLASLKHATEFLSRIETRDGSKKEKRKIVLTPGNHDHLQEAFGQLINDYKSIAILRRVLIWLVSFFTPAKHLFQILKDCGCKYSNNNLLDNWRSATGAFCTDERDVVVASEGIRLRFVPISSTSGSPLWMNKGEIGESDYHLLTRKLADYCRIGEIRIALLHHGLLSPPSPDETPLTSAYNSLYNSGQLCQALQDRGFEVLLHGHDHHSLLYSVDQSPDTKSKLLVSSSPASTIGGTGVGFIEYIFEDRFSLKRRPHFFKNGTYMPEPDFKTLILDGEAIGDSLTLKSRAEVRKYRYRDDDTIDFDRGCDNLISSDAKDVLTLGVTLRGFCKKSVLDLIRLSLANHHEKNIRVLLMEPDQLKAMDYHDISQEGVELSYRAQAYEEASRSLETLRRFRTELDDRLRCRFHVRTINRLLPFGASIAPGPKATGKAFILLLPVGAWSDQGRAHLQLEERHDEGLFQFFAQHSEEMWKIAKDT